MKIAICTPAYSLVTAPYASCMLHMGLKTAQAEFQFNGSPARAEIQLFMRSGSLLPMTRSLLVEDAVDWGADYLLWIDADHWFPDMALLRLLSWGLPVVGANYPRRVRPSSPTAEGLDGKPLYTTEEAAKADEITEVASLGLGFCLIDMNVIHALREIAPNGKPRRPFVIGMTNDRTDYVGEDVYFFRQVREAGYRVFLDHGLSWQIGHSFESMLFNSDALSDRAAFEAVQDKQATA